MKTWLDRKTIEAMNYAQRVMNSEKGDTNFISILMILGFVILLSGIFLGFKDQIVGRVTEIMNGFKIQ